MDDRLARAIAELRDAYTAEMAAHGYCVASEQQLREADEQLRVAERRRAQAEEEMLAAVYPAPGGPLIAAVLASPVERESQ